MAREKRGIENLFFVAEFDAVDMAVAFGVVDAEALFAAVLFADAAFAETFQLADPFSFMDVHFSVLS